MRIQSLKKSRINENKLKKFSQAQFTRRKQTKSNFLIWVIILVRNSEKIINNETCFEIINKSFKINKDRFILLI